jgi:hypothetical protein
MLAPWTKHKNNFQLSIYLPAMQDLSVLSEAMPVGHKRCRRAIFNQFTMIHCNIEIFNEN